MNDKIKALQKSINSIESVPQQEFEYLMGGLSEVAVLKGDFYSKLGDEKILAGFVTQGLLKSYYVDKNGNEFVRSFATNGSYLVALSSGLKNVPSNLYIKAIEDSIILSGDFSHWRSALARHPCWNIVHRKLTERYYIDREEHVIELLTLSGIERYHRFLDRFPSIASRIPQKDIAGYIGISAVSLSRLISSQQ